MSTCREHVNAAVSCRPTACGLSACRRGTPRLDGRSSSLQSAIITVPLPPSSSASRTSQDHIGRQAFLRGGGIPVLTMRNRWSSPECRWRGQCQAASQRVEQLDRPDGPAGGSRCCGGLTSCFRDRDFPDGRRRDVGPSGARPRCGCLPPWRAGSQRTRSGRRPAPRPSRTVPPSRSCSG